MSQPQPSTKPLAAFPRGALRVVLFGMPDAGKTSLLGALAQAADTQEKVLNAKLTDPTHGLEELQRQLYEENTRQTPEQIVPYPVRVEPYPSAPGEPPPPPQEAVLVDCDGRVANEILSRQRDLNGNPAESPLGNAVLGADTLILAVDASANPEVLKRDFGQFARFLRILEQSRSQRTDVGGLPVYLVLTKCDLLAKKGDTAVSWMERIEEHKRTVDRKFQEYLAQHAAREAQPFGKIDLHLWATAVKRPALGDQPPKPREPYGVAELFRQALDSARGYRGRRAEAGRRLGITVAVLAGLVSLLLLLGVFFYVNRPDEAVEGLENRVRVFRSEYPDDSANRLEDAADKVRKLEKLRGDPAFDQAPRATRDYVEGYLSELRAYEAYRQEVAAKALPQPRFLQDEGELKKLLARLEGLAPPAAHADAWKNARAVRQREQLLQEARALQREVNAATERYQSLVDRWTRVQAEPLTTAQRRAKERELLNEAERLPYRKDNWRAQVPGSQTLFYETVMQFERPAEAYREWQALSGQDAKGG
jgi:hypothetical protein